MGGIGGDTFSLLFGYLGDAGGEGEEDAPKKEV